MVFQNLIHHSHKIKVGEPILFQSMLQNYKITLRYLVANRFRMILLILFISSIIFLSFGDVDASDDKEEDIENESLGNILAFAVGVPLSILFTFIASIYYVHDRQFIKYDSGLLKWLSWSIVLVLLIGITPIIWALSGVIWFLFETTILALLFKPIITKIIKKHTKLIPRNYTTFLLLLSIIFTILTSILFRNRLEFENYLKSDGVYLELMIAGFILILITIWGLYFYLEKIQVGHNEDRLKALPLILLVAMIILYFEVFKGLLKDSDITWVSNISLGIEFLTPVVLFLAAILNLTQDIMQYVDLDLNLPRPAVRVHKIQNPYNYILGIYILYLSKYFYADLLGIGFALLYATIIFTFISILVLDYMMKSNVN